MIKYAYNLIWISSLTDGLKHIPALIPSGPLANLAGVIKQNQETETDVVLWVDKNGCTEEQITNLRAELAGAGKFQIRDLNEIDCYNKHPLFKQQRDAKDCIRDIDSSSVFWRQIELAKILILLHTIREDKYDYSCCSDLDVGNYNISKDETLKEVGIRIAWCLEHFENYFMAVSQTKVDFFSMLLAVSLKNIETSSWEVMYKLLLQPDFVKDFGIELDDIKFDTELRISARTRHAQEYKDITSSDRRK